MAAMVPENASDWASANWSSRSGEWNSSGKKGNTPPHSDVALMARYSA